MTPPTFQELLTSQEARLTNEQLEAWAGLGPIESKEYDGDSWWLYWSIGNAQNETICDFYQDGEDYVHAFAAAPALAAALLAERKAREVEVGELKRLQAERDFAILWIHRLANNPRKPSTWMETREAASNFLANLLQTGKDQPHD